MHYNPAGHKIIVAHDIAIIQGQIFRFPKLDFPPIAANSYQDLTVDYMYGARSNSTTGLGHPFTLTPGVVYQSFVSANDTVTIRAYNSTSSTIDPALQVIKVTVTF